MQWGGELKVLFDMQEDMGVTPKALENKPELVRRWEYPKELFDCLSGSRRYTSAGPANIPLSEYDKYAKAYGFSQTEYTEYWEDLQVVDSVWLGEIAKRRKLEEDQVKRSSRKGR